MPRPAPIRVLAGWRNRYRDDAVDSDAQRRASPASWLAQSIAAPVSFSPIGFGRSAAARTVFDTAAERRHQRRSTQGISATGTTFRGDAMSTRHRRRSRRRVLTVLIAVASTAIALTVFGGSAGAVHDTGAFELDGNPTSSAATPGDDWDNVCHQAAPTICPSGSNTTGATAVSFTNDGPVNGTIFTGGGSKDPSDISSWQWKNELGGLPAKDNLQNSFAARYSIPKSTTCPAAATAANCELLYFGSDRLDNSGDAQEGFWFFQNKITTDAATGKFNGVHKVGDLLILSDFSNGGGTSTINIYKWVGSGGDTNGTLNFLAGGTAAKCGGSSPDA